MVGYKPTQDKPGKSSSRLIASWTTSLARLRLFNILNTHQDQLLYCDTDSVYVQESLECPGPKASGQLGELKDELNSDYPGKNPHIISFASIGPKCYSLTIQGNDPTIFPVKARKTKGLHNVYVTEDDMFEMLETGSKKEFDQIQFRKNYLKESVHVKSEKKSLSMTSKKRVILSKSDEFDTLPYGHEGLSQN